ncbi:MAG: spore germination protein [Bacillota bacterium]|nr:spore germination protein [Bacillota bacterium]
MTLKKQNAVKENNKDNMAELNDLLLGSSLEENIALLRNIFTNDETLVFRRFQNRNIKAVKCCAVYFNGMIDPQIVNKDIIQPVLSSDLKDGIDIHNLPEELQYKVIASGNVNLENQLDQIVSSILYGNTLLLIENCEKALIISSNGWETRAITEPESEKVVRGPREGLTESIIMNITMIRRRIKDPDLKLKFREIGSKTHTRVCICYIENVASENILKELEKRLDQIDIDGIIDSGYIQELIRDAPFSPFETVGHTEKPDVVAAKLLEGRIAIISDCSPSVLTVPYIMIENSQSNEDYYNNFIYSSFNRFLRTISFVLAVSVPAVYLSIVTFHQEMLPTPLVLSISASKQGVPFPSFFSLLVMLLIFDLLREAATRMPTLIGQAVNIVGTLVLGQAAVEAKLVSAPVIIVTALSGILTLMNLKLIGAVIMIRFLFLILSSILGIYGYIFGVIAISLHLLSIRSFGVPYMLNVTTLKGHNWQDTFIRAPWWSMKLRPKIIGAKNLVRQRTKKTGGKKTG